jgi:hypothetical protein
MGRLLICMVQERGRPEIAVSSLPLTINVGELRQ